MVSALTATSVDPSVRIDRPKNVLIRKWQFRRIVINPMIDHMTRIWGPFQLHLQLEPGAMHARTFMPRLL